MDPKKYLTNDAIITGLKNNDRSAQLALYDKYGGSILGIIQGILGDRYQEKHFICILKDIFGSTHRLKPGENLFIWLFKLTRRNAFEIKYELYRDDLENLIVDPDRLAELRIAELIIYDGLSVEQIAGNLDMKSFEVMLLLKNELQSFPPKK